MFVDARSLPADERLDADLCIVGAGAAGIVLALTLAGAGRHIILVESGDLTPDPATQDLYRGQSVGLPYALGASRLRYFGGTTNHWQGACRALDAPDLAVRDWVPHSGWPFPRSVLDPYYERARPLCDLAPAPATVDDLRAAGGRPISWSGPLETAVWQMSPPTRFGEKYRAALEAAPGLTVLLNANLIGLATVADTSAVALARCGTLTGSRFAIAAGRYVLACGGIENARLLLLSGGGDPHGLGNRHDLVGRCFMEHPRDRSYTLVPYERTPMAFYVMHDTGRGPVMGRLALSEEAMRREHLLNMSITLFPPRRNYLVRRRRIRLLINLEQAPDPDNRVTLGAQRDALGLPKVQLEWRWREADQRNLERLRGVLGRELGRLGRLVSAPVPPDPNAHHHLGTTRMHRDQRQGVVGVHGRVHGLANLFVAGSSVFPTGGYANPTLTIVALALRLAAHLRARLG